MLSDQAEKLRRLASCHPPSGRSSRNRLTVLSGCKGGVGTTTVSLNLAAAIGRLGANVLLVDCSPFHGDLGHVYRLPNDRDIDDVLESRCVIQRAISPGPGGIQVLPRLGTKSAMSTATYWQLLRHLDGISHDFDHILIDAGSCTAAAETLWTAADRIVVITTPEQVAINDAYALVKCMTHGKPSTRSIGFAVNRYHNPQNADDLQDRLSRSCEQFLALQAESWGCIPADDLWAVAVHEARSIACVDPQAPSAIAIHQMAQRLASHAERSFDLNPVMAN